MTSRRKRHGVAQKWHKGDRYFTICHCGKMIRTESAKQAHSAMRAHRLGEITD